MKNLKRFLNYVKKYRVWVILALVCSFITSVGMIVATYYSGVAINNIHGINDVNFEKLIRILVWLAIIYFVTSVFQWLISRYANKISYLIVRDMRSDTFQSLNKLPLSFYDTQPHGDIISRFTNDLDSISDALVVSITSMFTGIVTIAFALAFMFYLNVEITLTVLLVTPISIIVARILTKLSQKTFKQQQQAVGTLSSYISEIVGNQKVVKAFSREEICQSQFDTISDDLYKVASKAMFASALINPSTRFVNNIGYIAVGLVGGVVAITKGVSVGVVSSFLIYSTQFAKPFNDISGISTQIQTAIASLDRIFEIIDSPEEIPDKENAIDLKTCLGNIKFDRVNFSYEKSQPIIKDFSFEAKSGQTIAIVGRTGCGKTTLVNLLMRFYEIDSGKICIDNIPITDIKRDSLHRLFGMVLQDSWVFDGTIKENIAYGNPNASDDDIVNCATSSFAHSFIKRLKDGYDTQITQDSLSQGQRQLITIARAMLANPKMLILDEATSSIDSLTEVRIQKAFLKLMEGRTSFVIAHRLSTILNADKILVIDNGNIIEQGTHKELLDNHGFYYELYNSQFA